MNIKYRRFSCINKLTQRLPTELHHLNRSLQDAKNFLNIFPKLDSIVLSQKARCWDNDYDRIQFNAFPSVSTLTFNDWPFNLDSHTAIQHQLDCSALKHLTLNRGCVLSVAFLNRHSYSGVMVISFNWAQPDEHCIRILHLDGYQELT